MQAAISTYNSNNKQARQFLEFLLSESSKVVFKNAGYIVDEKEVVQFWQ
jgi:ABC-type molybdate transport system substrate-binding protein